MIYYKNWLFFMQISRFVYLKTKLKLVLCQKIRSIIHRIGAQSFILLSQSAQYFCLTAILRILFSQLGILPNEITMVTSMLLSQINYCICYSLLWSLGNEYAHWWMAHAEEGIDELQGDQQLPSITDRDWLQEWTQLTRLTPPLPQVPQEACMIVTPLNSSSWRTMLLSYPHRATADFFLQGLNSGFRIGCTSNPSELKSAKRNMQSALLHPEVVSNYLRPLLVVLLFLCSRL